MLPLGDATMEIRGGLGVISLKWGNSLSVSQPLSWLVCPAVRRCLGGLRRVHMYEGTALLYVRDRSASRQPGCERASSQRFNLAELHRPAGLPAKRHSLLTAWQGEERGVRLIDTRCTRIDMVEPQGSRIGPANGRKRRSVLHNRARVFPKRTGLSKLVCRRI